MADMQRYPTGIPGLDEMIGGGFTEGTANLLIGQPGTGRTIFSFQFLHAGSEMGMKCMFITLNHTKEYLQGKYIARYPEDADKMDKEIFFVYLMPENLMAMSDVFGFEIEEVIRQLGINRLVVDPFSVLEDQMVTRTGFKSSDLFRVVNSFRTQGATSLLVVRTDPNNPIRSAYGYAELFADNVCCLFRQFPNEDYLQPYQQVFLISKLRGKIYKTARIVKYDTTGLFMLEDKPADPAPSGSAPGGNHG